MGKWRIIAEEFFKALGVSFPVATGIVALMLLDVPPEDVLPQAVRVVAFNLAMGALGTTVTLAMLFASILHGLSPTVKRLLYPRHDEQEQHQEKDDGRTG